MYYIYILYILGNLRQSWTIFGSFRDPLWTHLGLSWAVFGAILNHFGVILGPFLSNFETILRASSKQASFLGPHSWGIFGRSDFFHFGTHFGPQLGTRGPSGASKNKKLPCQKPQKTVCFLWFLAQEGSQEAPKELQNPNKKGSKNGPKYEGPGRKCLKPAIALLTHFGTHFGTQNWVIFGVIFWKLFDNFLEFFWKPCWDPFWDQIRPRRTKMSPRGPLGASKSQKTALIKMWFSRGTVGIFSLLRPPKRASRGPRRLPRGTQRTLKPPKKDIQNWTQKLTIFRQILEQFWLPKWILKKLQKWDHFWHPLPPHLLSLIHIWRCRR